jgi:hypothetical protein
MSHHNKISCCDIETALPLKFHILFCTGTGTEERRMVQVTLFLTLTKREPSQTLEMCYFFIIKFTAAQQKIQALHTGNL